MGAWTIFQEIALVNLKFLLSSAAALETYADKLPTQTMGKFSSGGKD
jgi:hypothetical protein